MVKRMDRKTQAATLRGKAQAFWETLLASPETMNLKSPLVRKTKYEDLNRDQRITLAVFVTQYEKAVSGVKETNGKGEAQAETITQPPVTPDEIIAPQVETETET